MYYNLLSKTKNATNRQGSGANKKLAFRIRYKRICYEVYSISEEECSFSKNYCFEAGDFLESTYYVLLPCIEKERLVPVVYLDYICVFMEAMAVSELCRKIDASDDKETRIIQDNELEIIIRHKGMEVFHSFNKTNYNALKDKQVIQEIKSLLFDVEMFFDSVLNMSDIELHSMKMKTNSTYM